MDDVDHQSGAAAGRDRVVYQAGGGRGTNPRRSGYSPAGTDSDRSPGGFFAQRPFHLQPNEARVLILFGAYKGSVRQSGFWWANPLYSRIRGQPLTTGSAA